MENKLRNSGIDIIGDISWGKHFCQFYHTKEDLIEILVPYFIAGLKSNESCLWVSSESLNTEEAKKALNGKLKNLDEFIKKGQLEIFDFRQWYTQSGRFDSEEVLSRWIEKEKQALKKGFDGLRLSRNTFWLDKKEWKDFSDYEASINHIIDSHRMLAVCTYSLDKCTASEIIDVVNNHQYALIKQEGQWKLIQSFEYKHLQETLIRERYHLEKAQEIAHVGTWELDVEADRLIWTDEVYRIFGLPKGTELTYERFLECVHPDDREYVDKKWKAALEKEPYKIKHRILVNGEIKWVKEQAEIKFDERGHAVRGIGAVQDITEQKKAEQALKESELTARAILNASNDVAALMDIEGIILDANEALARRFNKSVEAIKGTNGWDLFPIDIVEKRKQYFNRVILSKKPVRFEDEHNGIWFDNIFFPILDAQGNVKKITLQARDITQHKQQDWELALRNEIANIFLTESDAGIYNKVLDVILKTLESRYGLFGYINQNGDLVLSSMTKDIWDECKVPDKTVVFPRKKWGGIWGKALIEKKMLYSNSPMSVPNGHIPISRVLVAPIVFNKRVVGIFEIANKAVDYDENDRNLLTKIAEKIAPVLYARLQRDTQQEKRLRAERTLKNLRRQMDMNAGFAGIVALDPKMLEIFDTIKELAEIDVPVMIQGESGTGKELVAMAIHNEGHRAHQPFIAVNCSALPEGLLESELFGHVRGAFTGAIRDKKGRFELANNGTIFLDEIGDVSPTLQVKLLRVLQEGTFERVGDENTRRVNVRVISATNKDLMREIKEGRFRSDLFYRMCVVPITIPPLRERRNDIPLLVDHILKNSLYKQKKKEVKVSPEALSVMMNYHWPGNVRELQNAIQYALVKCGSDLILKDQLPPSIISSYSNERFITKRKRRRKLSSEAVRWALQETQGNKKEASRKLGVSRATLYRFLDSKKI
ncbi:MAG: sigma 54-interacting transcriptional regulator [Nitrospirota bacterium]|nr:sigma 54-interacting transcriptional regulator [Candidatus Aminicenantes bacterium]MDH5383321.1 sigma 54-interacting transcriptional regulator [Candidatus Aminicenantes bacterium]MDH5768426.1 sigma 54-interacting transcriptional regulator [Nitrospirota bacterium]